MLRVMKKIQHRANNEVKNLKLEDSERCELIADHYGLNNQISIAIEELSELTKELCKFKRYRNNREQIIDECADVLIMVDQLLYLFNAGEEVDERIDFKLSRQLKRISEERE